MLKKQDSTWWLYLGSLGPTLIAAYFDGLPIVEGAKEKKAGIGSSMFTHIGHGFSRLWTRSIVNEIGRRK